MRLVSIEVEDWRIIQSSTPIDTNFKLRLFYQSQSQTFLEGLSVDANACNPITYDQRIIQNPTSDIVKAPQGKKLFLLELYASYAATKTTSSMFLGGFLQALRLCKKNIEEERYMYGYVLFLLFRYFIYLQH